MIGTKLKQYIDDINSGNIDEVTDENERHYERLRDTIAAIKASAESSVAYNHTINIDNDGRVYMCNYNFDDDRLVDVDVDFFTAFDNTPFRKTIGDFREWLNIQDIESVYIKYEYDNGGVNAWNSYWLVL